MSDLLTVRQIAQFAKRRLDQLLYVMRSRKIEPTLHMGNLRLFDEQAVRVILREATAVDAKRSRGTAALESEGGRGSPPGSIPSFFPPP